MVPPSHCWPVCLRASSAARPTQRRLDPAGVHPEVLLPRHALPSASRDVSMVGASRRTVPGSRCRALAAPARRTAPSWRSGPSRCRGGPARSPLPSPHPEGTRPERGGRQGTWSRRAPPGGAYLSVERAGGGAAVPGSGQQEEGALHQQQQQRRRQQAAQPAGAHHARAARSLRSASPCAFCSVPPPFSPCFRTPPFTYLFSFFLFFLNSFCLFFSLLLPVSFWFRPSDTVAELSLERPRPPAKPSRRCPLLFKGALQGGGGRGGRGARRSGGGCWGGTGGGPAAAGRAGPGRARPGHPLALRGWDGRAPVPQPPASPVLSALRCLPGSLPSVPLSLR